MKHPPWLTSSYWILLVLKKLIFVVHFCFEAHFYLNISLMVVSAFMAQPLINILICREYPIQHASLQAPTPSLPPKQLTLTSYTDAACHTTDGDLGYRWWPWSWYNLWRLTMIPTWNLVTTYCNSLHTNVSHTLWGEQCALH